MLKAIHVINTGHLTEAHVLLLHGLSHLGDDDPVDAVHISELWINTARPLPALDGLHLVLIEALIEALPGEARPHFLKGKHYVQHELYSEAADAFLACAALAEDQPESLGIAVELLLESGRVTEAIAAAEEGMLLFPMLPRFHLGLAQAHSELGHFEQVVQACQSGWPLVIDDENMHRRYGGPMSAWFCSFLIRLGYKTTTHTNWPYMGSDWIGRWSWWSLLQHKFRGMRRSRIRTRGCYTSAERSRRHRFG